MFALILRILAVALWTILLLSLVVGFALPNQPAWFVAGAIALACIGFPWPVPPSTP